MEDEGENSPIDNAGCKIVNQTFYDSVLGIKIAMPEWEAVLTAVILSAIVALTIVGNVLVIISVFTCRRLRVAQNFFIVSLAVTDLAVAVIVLPLNIASSILGRWDFGMHLCKIWLTSDILCCTASILHLCVVALDRYWAITDPINYVHQRTLKRVLFMIAGVWIISAIVSSPPLFGWNDWPSADNWSSDVQCKLTSRQGFVVYSSLGSFFIPGFIMTVIYIEIFIATKMRLRARAKAVHTKSIKQNALVPKANVVTKVPDVQREMSNTRTSVSSTLNDPPCLADLPSEKSTEIDKKTKVKFKQKLETKIGNRQIPVIEIEDSITENFNSQTGSDQRKSLNDLDGELQSPCLKTCGLSPSMHVPAIEVKKPAPVYAFIDEKKRISLSRERRAARTLGIIMGAFVLCWLPFALLYVIPDAFKCDLTKTTSACTWLGYMNSSLNPIIYTIFNLDFRRSFKKLLHLPP